MFHTVIDGLTQITRADFFVGGVSSWAAGVLVNGGSPWATAPRERQTLVSSDCCSRGSQYSQYAQSVMMFLRARSGLFRLPTPYIDQIILFTHQLHIQHGISVTIDSII